MAKNIWRRQPSARIRTLLKSRQTAAAGAAVAEDFFEQPVSGGAIAGAGQIASAGSTGTPALGVGISAASVASAQAFGTPALAAAVAASGVASAQALGTPALAAAVAASGVSSAQAFGALQIAAHVAPVGVGPGEAVGAPEVGAAAAVNLAGIESGEAVGQPSVAVHFIGAGIAAADAAGVPALQVQVAVAGVGSSSAVGSVQLALEIYVAGIGTAQAFGTPTVSEPGSAHSIELQGVTPASAVGAPVVGVRQPGGAVGRRRRNGGYGFLPETVSPAAAVLALRGIASHQAFGLPAVMPGPLSPAMRRHRDEADLLLMV